MDLLGDVGKFVAKTVDTGKSFIDSASAGARDAGDFVVRVAKDDAKDLVQAGRFLSNVYGPGFTAGIEQGMKHLDPDLAAKTDWKKQSLGSNFKALGNSMLNVASFIPGLGAGVKAAKEGVRGSKYVKAGAKTVAEAVNKTHVLHTTEKEAINKAQKVFEATLGKKPMQKINSAVADSVAISKTKDWRKLFPKGTSSERYADALEKVESLRDRYQKVNFKGNPVMNYIDELLVDKRAAEAMKYAGKAALVKGSKILTNAAKHGFNAGSKQFAAQSANIWRKDPGREKREREQSQEKTANVQNQILRRKRR